MSPDDVDELPGWVRVVLRTGVIALLFVLVAMVTALLIALSVTPVVVEP